MAGSTDTYSKKGAIQTATFSLVVMAVSGLVLYLSAPEKLRCERDALGRARCRLERRVAGVAIRDRDLGFVQRAEVKDSSADSEESSPTFWLLIYTDHGWVESVQSHDYGDNEDVRQHLQGFLEDAKVRTLDAKLPGTPSIVPYALGVFAFGAALMPLWLLGLVFPWMRPLTGEPRPGRTGP
jgi:hypothetical protein